MKHLFTVEISVVDYYNEVERWVSNAIKQWFKDLYNREPNSGEVIVVARQEKNIEAQHSGGIAGEQGTANTTKNKIKPCINNECDLYKTPSEYSGCNYYFLFNIGVCRNYRV